MSDILVKNPIMEKKFNWSNSSGKKLIGKNCTHIFTNKILILSQECLPKDD